jgi:hypothetical protein
MWGSLGVRELPVGQIGYGRRKEGSVTDGGKRDRERRVRGGIEQKIRVTDEGGHASRKT